MDANERERPPHKRMFSFFPRGLAGPPRNQPKPCLILRQSTSRLWSSRHLSSPSRQVGKNSLQCYIGKLRIFGKVFPPLLSLRAPVQILWLRLAALRLRVKDFRVNPRAISDSVAAAALRSRVQPPLHNSEITFFFK